jgi:pyruvate-formate lyase-activating enzyme
MRLVLFERLFENGKKSVPSFIKLVQNFRGKINGSPESLLDSPSFCTAPWVHAHLGSEGLRRLCCVAEPAPAEAQGLSIENFTNSPYMKNVRRKMMTGQALPECQACENPNRTDRYRTTLNQRFGAELEGIRESTSSDGHTTFKPVFIDYRAHACNLKCKTCNPESSSSWLAHARANPAAWKGFYNPEHLEKVSRLVASSPYEKEIAPLLSQSSVREIYFAGGEPLVSAAHDGALDLLIESGRAASVTLRYNTNLNISQARLNAWLARLSHFPRVDVRCSIDGVGEINDYVRTGGDISLVAKNLDSLLAYRTQHAGLSALLDPTLTSLMLTQLREFSEFALAKGVPVAAKLMAGAEFTSLYLRCELLPKAVRSALVAEWLAYYEKLPVGKRLYLDNLKDTLTLVSTLPEFSPEQLKRSVKHAQIVDKAFQERTTFGELLSRHPVAAAWWNTVQS